jgi:hypothetical protein
MQDQLAQQRRGAPGRIRILAVDPVRSIAADDFAFVAAVGSKADLDDAVGRIAEPSTDDLRCLLIRSCGPGPGLR